MVIVIEEGANGLWYGISGMDGPYPGLMIVEDSLDKVLDNVGPAIKALRKARQEAALQDLKEALQK